MKALIIEDNPAFAACLKDSLSNKGWNVTLASSWDEAKSTLTTGRFDVWLIDILLPKTSGAEILNTIKDQPIIHNSHFILMSGLFTEQSMKEKVPGQLKNRTICMTKPIDDKLLMETLSSFMQNKTFTGTNIAIRAEEPSSFDIPKDRSFHGCEATGLLFKAHKSKFEGELTVHTQVKETIIIEFNEGNITKVPFTHKESFFGALLMKHGLLQKKDLQTTLDKNSYTPMGQKLIQDGLLSPHLVSFILKEQIKVRINRIVSSRSFTAETLSKSIEVSDEAAVFNEQDFMEWTIDCIKTKFTRQWMQSFFDKNKDNFIQPTSPITSHFNHPFIKNFQALFDKINKSSTLNDIVHELSPKIPNQKMKKITVEDYRTALEIIYFGIITQSLQIRTKERILKKTKKLEQMADQILECGAKDLFLVFGLPEKASVEEVSISYKQIAKLLHPDRHPPNMSEKLKQKCHKAFIKATETLNILTDPEKRDQYLKNTDDSTFINIISLYEEGLQALHSGNYTLAVHLFSKVQDKPKAPSNTMLYMIWAQIKANPANMKDKNFAGGIKKQINSIPNEERASYMFWFISGLYCSYTEKYAQAISLFKKTLELKKDFKEAKTEFNRARLFQDKTQSASSENNKGIFSKFFKTG